MLINRPLAPLQGLNKIHLQLGILIADVKLFRCSLLMLGLNVLLKRSP